MQKVRIVGKNYDYFRSIILLTTHSAIFCGNKLKLSTTLFFDKNSIKLKRTIYPSQIILNENISRKNRVSSTSKQKRLNQMLSTKLLSQLERITEFK